jgi:tight adherence protein C
MVIVIVIAVVLFGIAIAFIAAAMLEPRVRRSENLSQIEAYGYASRVETGTAPKRQTRKSLDQLAASVGDLVARRLLNVRDDELQRELISAGFFNIGVRRFLGYRALLAVVLPVLCLWFFGVLLGSPLALVLILIVFTAGLGWVGPSFYVHRRARVRLRTIDEALPGLIDLLVVTLEAGVAFTAALRLAAERVSGPLGEEVRLTIQEQSLGLSTLEALENWLRRCDTPSVRSFVRAMVQGDRLGVSIGQILRNQAVEMRARQKAVVEERAQKAPIKILFPLVFLIFPAMFVIILGPAVFQIAKSLHS